MSRIDPRLQLIIDWISRTTDAKNGRRALIPVSGGTDSALCFWLLAQALPRGHAIGAYIGSNLRCREWFESVGEVHLLPELRPDSGFATEPEMMRWMLMLSHARTVRGWLTGSRNRTEDVLGSYSLASRIASYLPIVGLWKSEVMELSQEIGVPDEILRSSLQADPACGRPVEMAAIPFADVDVFLKVRIGERPADDLQNLVPPQVEYLEKVYARNRFKTLLPMSPVADALRLEFGTNAGLSGRPVS